jgi:hypothetical protein
MCLYRYRFASKKGLWRRVRKIKVGFQLLTWAVQEVGKEVYKPFSETFDINSEKVMSNKQAARGYNDW